MNKPFLQMKLFLSHIAAVFLILLSAENRINIKFAAEHNLRIPFIITMKAQTGSKFMKKYALYLLYFIICSGGLYSLLTGSRL